MGATLCCAIIVNACPISKSIKRVALGKYWRTTNDTSIIIGKSLSRIVAVSFTFIWVLFSSILFASLEDWSYFEAIWFCYVTISTIGYGDFTAAAKVHRLTFIVPLSRCDQSIGGIFNEEEFAGGRAIAPQFDGIGSVVFCVFKLPDKGRDNVGRFQIEVVAGAVEIDG